MIFKCKMCGGDLLIQEGMNIAECEYCGSLQTLPKMNSDKKTNLYDRANHFRRNNDYDKAMMIYEQILNEDTSDAEAYWSLVLCRYGIEYVEDPMTHKRVPTVNRAQLTSIYADENYKAAIENADADQRQIYEAEAKAIDEIQKGILAISQKEDPFDVFICYKETDQAGRRTPDSVLANDLYHQLKNEGFKVFFSHITLEDKLGSAYEPYIFAALNSAKVMVVLGTRPEYFKAVWVRNEWSRFLSLIKQGAKKTLVPAYRDMDPYDLPEEFSHLQAQDMSKLGFMSDLVRGIKKITEVDQSPKVTAQETLVVNHTPAAGNVTALLKRGSIALEDGDWKKADGFYEEVLNQDAECAEAYLGKALAQSRCSTLKKLVEWRLGSTIKVDIDNLLIKPETGHIEKMAREYAVSGYWEADKIKPMYGFNLQYASVKAGRKRQYEEENKFWQCNRQLSRAFQFAQGHLKQELDEARENTLMAMEQRIEEAGAIEKANQERTEKNYRQHIAAVDAKVKEQSSQAARDKKNYYDYQCRIAEHSNMISELQQVEQAFRWLENYLDSPNMVKRCQERVKEIQNELEAEAARAEAARAEATRIRNAKIKKITILSSVATTILIALVLVITLVIIPNNKYGDAEKLLAAGQYAEAMTAFHELDGHKDSKAKRAEAFELLKAEFKQQAEMCLEKENNIGAAIQYQRAGEIELSQSIFDITGQIALDEFVTAGIMADWRLEYISNHQYDDVEDVSADLAGVVKFFNDTDGICGVDAAGRLLVHQLSTMDRVEVTEAMNISQYSGIIDIEHGIEDEYYIIMLREDGTIAVAGSKGLGVYESAEEWTDIVAMDSRYNMFWALDIQGRIHVTNPSGYIPDDVDMDALNAWPAVKKVLYHDNSKNFIGLTMEGTIVSMKPMEGKMAQATERKDVQDMILVTFGIVLLYQDGTTEFLTWSQTSEMSPVYKEIENGFDSWYGVVQVVDGNNMVYGITYDGRVLFQSCDIEDGKLCQYEEIRETVSQWSDIVAIVAMNYYDYGHANTVEAVGIKEDGTVTHTADGHYYRSVKNEYNDNYHDERHEDGTYHLVDSWKLWDVREHE